MIATLNRHRRTLTEKMGLKNLNGFLSHADVKNTSEIINKLMVDKYGIVVPKDITLPAYIIDFILTIEGLDKWEVVDEDTDPILILDMVYESVTGKRLKGLLNIIQIEPNGKFRYVLYTKIKGKDLNK